MYPADTIWGIGCDAADRDAIARLYTIKGRDMNRPLIVLVSDLDQLYEVAAEVHPRIDTLLHYHERPLTVVYPSAHESYSHLAASDGSIAVRIVKSGFCHELIAAYGHPLVSTSANFSGERSAVTFEMISPDLIARVDYVLPAFTERDITGAPSAIARYDENGELDFLR